MRYLNLVVLVLLLSAHSYQTGAQSDSSDPLENRNVFKSYKLDHLDRTTHESTRDLDSSHFNKFLPGIPDSTILSVLENVNEDSIGKTVQDLVNFKSRFEFAPGRTQARDYLVNRLEKYGYEVQLDEYSFPAPFMWVIYSIKGTNHLMVGGDLGLTMKSEDGGSTFVESKIIPETNFLNIEGFSFVNDKLGWACDYNGHLYKTVDGGITWNLLQYFQDYVIYKITFLDSSEGWATARYKQFHSPYGIVIHTTDGGETWTTSKGVNSNCFYDIDFVSSDSGWVAGKMGQMMSTSDGGNSWTVKTLPGLSSWEFRCIDFYNSKYGVVGGYQPTTGKGGAFVTSDGGQSWTQIYSSEGGYVNDIEMTTADEVYIVDFYAASISKWSRNTNSASIISKSPDYYTSLTVFNNKLASISQSELYITDVENIQWTNTIPTPLYRPSENVVATKKASISTDSVIVLGAHYDSISDNALFDAPGADDNASGSAGIIEMARVLQDIETSANLQFCLFSAEELGLNGSHHFAKNCQDNNVPIKVYFNFDMIAYPGQEPWTLRLSCWKDALKYLEVAKQATSAYTTLEHVEFIKKAGASDHKSFQDQGYTILTFGEVNTGTGNPYYHTTQDIYETLSILFEKELLKAALGTLLHIQPDYPTQIAESDFKAPNSLEIWPNYPNPFNSSTTIKFNLPAEEFATIDIINLSGKHIETVVSTRFDAGIHNITWNAGNKPSGIYFYRFKSSTDTRIGKMLLVQ